MKHRLITLITVALAASLALPSASATTTPHFAVRVAWGTPDGLTYSAAKAAGFTAVNTSAAVTDVRAAKNAGVLALVWVGQYQNASCSWDLSDATVKSEVQALHNAGLDATVWAYYLSDEPDVSVCPDSPAQHTARRTLIRTVVPGAKTMTILRDDQPPATWKGKVNKLWVDSYPCNYSDSSCTFADLTTVGHAMDAAGVHQWGLALQAFGEGSGSGYYRMPTATEMTSEFATAAKTSATWLGWYTYSGEAQNCHNVSYCPAKVAALNGS